MSMRAQFEAAEQRAREDHSITKTVEVAQPVIKPEDDVELQAALAKVADGKLVAASRTRNGVLVETKGSAVDETQLHALQQGGDR